MPSIKRKQQKKYWSNQIKFTNEAHKMYSVYTASPYHDTMIVIVSFLTGGGNPFHNLEKTSVLQEVFFPFLCIFMNILCYDLKKNVINVVQLENAVYVDSFGFTVVFQTITIHNFTSCRWIIFSCPFVIDKSL